MLCRVLTLFFAFALLWPGFSAAEPWLASAQLVYAQQPALADAPGQAAGHEGGVERSDDQPPQNQAQSQSQTQTETQTEPPGLLLAMLAHSVPALVMAQPRAVALAEVRPPFLAGPLRPPCSVTRAG